MKTEDIEKTEESSQGRTDLEILAKQQGITPINNFDGLLGDFWPEDESADEFISAVREWRREGEKQRTTR